MTTLAHPTHTERIHVDRNEPIEPENSIFLIGRNSHGNWVVRDQNGLCGGIFIGEAAAFKFALSENGNHPEAVRMVNGTLELDIASPRAA